MHPQYPTASSSSQQSTHDDFEEYSQDSEYYIVCDISPFPGGSLEPPPESPIDSQAETTFSYSFESIVIRGMSKSEPQSALISPLTESSLSLTQMKSKSAPLKIASEPLFPVTFGNSEPLTNENAVSGGLSLSEESAITEEDVFPKLPLIRTTEIVESSHQMVHSSNFYANLEFPNELELVYESDTVASPSLRRKFKRKKKKSKIFGYCSPFFCISSHSMPSSPVHNSPSRRKTPLNASELLEVDIHSRELFSLRTEQINGNEKDDSDNSVEYVLRFEQREDVNARLLNSSFKKNEQKYLHGWGAGILLSSAARLGKMPKLLPLKSEFSSVHENQDGSIRSFDRVDSISSGKGNWEMLEKEEEESVRGKGGAGEGRQGEDEDDLQKLGVSRNKIVITDGEEKGKGKRMEKTALVSTTLKSEFKVSSRNPLFSNKKVTVSSKYFGRRSMANTSSKKRSKNEQNPTVQYANIVSSPPFFIDSNSEESSKNEKEDKSLTSTEEMNADDVNIIKSEIDDGDKEGIRDERQENSEKRNHKDSDINSIHEDKKDSSTAAAADDDDDNDDDNDDDGNEDIPLVRALSDSSLSNHTASSQKYSIKDLVHSKRDYSGQISELVDSVDSQSQTMDFYEYGSIGLARSKSRNSDHWMWLFMDYLENLVKKLSENETVQDEPSPSPSPSSSSSSFTFPSVNERFCFQYEPADRSFHSIQSSLMDLKLLESKFKGVESSIKRLSFTSLLEILIVGLSVWLKFWDIWGEDKLPPWKSSSSSPKPSSSIRKFKKKETEAYATTSKATLPDSSHGKASRQQRKKKKNTLMDKPSHDKDKYEDVNEDEGVKEDENLQPRLLSEIMGKKALDFPINQFEVLKFTSLACSFSHYRPATAIFLLLHLLERIGMSESMSRAKENERSIENETFTKNSNSNLHTYRGYGHFVVSCLNSILSASIHSYSDVYVHTGSHTSPSIKSTNSEETVLWQIPKLSLLAETCLGKAISSATHVPLIERMDEIDRLHNCFKLSPNFLSICTAVELHRLPFVCCDDIMSMSIHMEEVGCEEASFHSALRAVATGRLDSNGFDHVIQMSFYGHGIKNANSRFSKLLAIVKSAHFSLLEDSSPSRSSPSLSPSSSSSSSYIAEFVSALLRVTGAERKFPWAYNSTLHFARLHCNGDENSDILNRLTSIVTLQRWMSLQSEEEKKKGKILVIERMSNPEKDVSWTVWIGIAKILEERYQSMAQTVCTMKAKAICSIFKKINSSGLSRDSVSLSTFDWAIEGLLTVVTQNEGASGFVSLLNPSRCENVVDVILSVAARLSATEYSFWSSFSQKAVFIAQLLSLAYENDLEMDQRRYAVGVALLVWGWALPNPSQLSAKCSSKEELEYVLEKSAVSMWNSVVAAGYSPEMGNRRL